MSIQHPLGFNWHPLEGAGSLYMHTYTSAVIEMLSLGISIRQKRFRPAIRRFRLRVGTAGILLMEESGDHQLRLVVYPTIYMVLYIPGGWEWDFFHQQYFRDVRWLFRDI